MHPVGVSGLVGSLILKPRKSVYQEDRSDLTKLLTFIGGAMLWVGWFGLNAGSAMSAGNSPNHYISLACVPTYSAAFAPTALYVYLKHQIKSQEPLLRWRCS